MGKKLVIIVLMVVIAGPFLLPEEKVIPVAGALPRDWHPQTFWYEPWGESGVHKGMDIFASKGTPVLATTTMLKLRVNSGSPKGGNSILGLGPVWRIHYFAHLDTINPGSGFLLSKGEVIGTVGNSGNAAGRPAHLHYAIYSVFPRPWLADDTTQGTRKAFILNPVSYLEDAQQKEVALP